MTNNLKPFDVAKAKAGAKVVTRDGRDVTILAYDVELSYLSDRIVALVNDGCGNRLETYMTDGRYYDAFTEDSLDLFMAPTIRTAYGNLHKVDGSYMFLTSIKENAADLPKTDFPTFVSVAKITWEE